MPSVQTNKNYRERTEAGLFHVSVDVDEAGEVLLSVKTNKVKKNTARRQIEDVLSRRGYLKGYDWYKINNCNGTIHWTHLNDEYIDAVPSENNSVPQYAVRPQCLACESGADGGHNHPIIVYNL